jgi:mRNA-degrading endonuclease RelE of RelBE toxin-antitoxin system
MPYKILPTKEFSKDFSKLDGTLKDRIKTKIEETAQNPEHAKHLHYDLAGSCRLRIGKTRIIFSYNAVKQELYLEKIIVDHDYRK